MNSRRPNSRPLEKMAVKMLHRVGAANDDEARVPVPFRWAGGKQRQLARLKHFIPKDYDQRTYREPFLGGASLFLTLIPRRAILSDANEHLMQCYVAIRDNVEAVSRVLAELAACDSEENYYEVRRTYIEARPSASNAARFIYLNRTCFNGIFRVNKRGEFNVPYGFRDRPIFPTKRDLRAVSWALGRATLRTNDYAKSVRRASKGDFVYLDPPYPALNGTSFFTHYTADRFSSDDQHTLAGTVQRLDKRGCLVMMTNADTPTIRKLYKGFYLTRLPVTRYVTYRSTKHRVNELVITNYGVEN